MLFLTNNHSDDGPAPYGEPYFSYLNRSGRADSAHVRQTVEEWFERYPQEHKNEFRSRFRSNDDIGFLSCFFELYLHEILLQLGHVITVHPELLFGSGKRPDFYAQSPDGRGFYLEAVLATSKSDEKIAAERRINAVYDAINRLESPNFFIGIKMRGAPNSPPPGRKIRSFLRQQLKDLDPGECFNWTTSGGFDVLPRWPFSYDGWDVEFFAIPKSPASRGNTDIRPLSMHMPMEAKFIDCQTPIREAVSQKAGRYGQLSSPYIIAVNALDFFVKPDDVVAALFGSEQVVFSTSQEAPYVSHVTRAPDGVWVGKGGPQNTRVSAVLACTSVYPWSVAAIIPCLYHNPWARLPYEGEMNRLHHAKPTNNVIEWIQGTEPRELFGLPKAWPKRTSPPDKSA